MTEHSPAQSDLTEAKETEAPSAADRGGDAIMQPPPHAPTDVADSVEYELDPRYISLQRRVNWLRWLRTTALSFAVLYVVIRFGRWIPPTADTLAYATWGLVTLLNALRSHIWPAVSFRYARYTVSLEGLEVKEGVFFRTVTNVPRSRVQHTDVSQGPFERSLGLASLLVHTAGRAFAVVTVRGLPHEKALRIRDYLLPRDRLDDI